MNSKEIHLTTSAKNLWAKQLEEKRLTHHFRRTRERGKGAGEGGGWSVTVEYVEEANTFTKGTN